MSGDGKRESEEHGALTAAEYVLGVLDAEARRAAERRLESDPAFAREVQFWESRFAPLAEAVPPVAPPTDAWARIEAAVTRESRAAQPRRSLWNSLPLWRSLAFASAALAVACLVALILTTRIPAPGPLIAQLAGESGAPSFYAAVDPGGTHVTVLPAALITLEGQRAFELWLIPDGDKPHSLGLIDPAKPARVKIPEALEDRVGREAVLAVSLEPAGGSPTGQPTGPVVANGKLTLF